MADCKYEKIDTSKQINQFTVFGFFASTYDRFTEFVITDNATEAVAIVVRRLTVTDTQIERDEVVIVAVVRGCHKCEIGHARIMTGADV